VNFPRRNARLEVEDVHRDAWSHRYLDCRIDRLERSRSKAFPSDHVPWAWTPKKSAPKGQL
jgi:hypothetical protein